MTKIEKIKPEKITAHPGTPPYGMTTVIGKGKQDGSYRVFDSNDYTVALCPTIEAAMTVLDALNFMHAGAVPWTCGHTAPAQCAECWTELAQRATKLQEACDTMATKEPYD